MSLDSVTPDSDPSNVTRNDVTRNDVTRNGAPMSNAERQRLYRQRQKVRQSAPGQATTTGAAEPSPSTTNGSNVITIKPRKPRPGGHKLRRENPDRPKRVCPPTPVAEKPHVDPARPALRTEVIVAEIFDRLSHGETLTQICKDAHLPSRTTVLRWVNEDPDFAVRFARARDLQFEHWADTLADVANTVRGDPTQVPAARLDSENKRWLLARLKPSLYSEKFQADITSAGKAITVASDLDIAKALAHALAAPALPAPMVIDVEVTEVPPTDAEGT